MTVETKRKFLIDTAFIVLIAAILYFVFRFCMIYLLPFVIGLLLAVIVQRPANFISQKTKIGKGVLSVILVVILYLATISLITGLGFFAYNRISLFISSLPQYLSTLSEIFGNLSTRLSNVLEELPDKAIAALNSMPETIISRVTSAATGFLSTAATTVVKSAPSLLITVIVTVVASCYLAKDYDRIMRFIHSRMNKKTNRIISSTKEIFFNSILKLVKSYLLLMMITFAELSLGLLIIGVKNPVTVAAIIAVIDLLPVLGTGAVVIPWGIVALISGNVWRGIGLLLLYLIITIVRNFLEPKIIGDQVGLYPLVTLIAMFVGLRLFGMFGMLAFPVALIIIVKLQKQGTINLFGTPVDQKE